MVSSSKADRPVGMILSALVGLAAFFASYVVILFVLVAFTAPDRTGSRAPGIVANVAIGMVSLVFAATCARRLFRMITRPGDQQGDGGSDA
jgi:hypothetical protein